MPPFVLLLMGAFFAADALPSRRRASGSGAAACRCVPTNMCADEDATANGQGLLDVRAQDDLCNNYFETCCENPIGEFPPQKKSVYNGCGSQNSIELATRITTDSTAEFGELPWTVAILLRDIDNTHRTMYICGGSLIHPQVILTAAHCVDRMEAEHFTVRVGEWDTKSENEPLPHQNQIVREISRYPLYQSGSLKNDISLLFVSNPFALTPNVGLICLPPPNFLMEGGMCTAGGWGKGASKYSKHSPILKKVHLPLVSRVECLAALRSTRLGAFFNLHASFICAGGEGGRDTCKGDGGSPLVCPIPGGGGRFFQMGIVSWGIGCGETETPGVYVNVPLYVSWINEQLLSRNLDISLYKY